MQPRTPTKADKEKLRSLQLDAIVNYVLAYPHLTLRQVAKAAGVSERWLASVIHTDAFQAQLQKRTDEIFQATVLPLRERVMGTAAMAVERMAEALEQSDPVEDRDYIMNVAELALKAAGLGGGKGIGEAAMMQAQQNNYYLVDPDMLEKARQVMRAIPEAQGPLKELESGERAGLEHSPSGAHALGGAGSVGAGGGVPAELCESEAPAQGQAGARPAVREEGS